LNSSCGEKGGAWRFLYLSEPARTFGVPIQVSASGKSDVGLLREHNEDSYVLLQRHGLYVVADGMGGHKAGDVASRLATEIMSAFFDSTAREDATWPFQYEPSLSTEENRLLAAIKIANRQIYEHGSLSDDHRGMGTTIVCVLVTENTGSVYIGHVGDSRCYRVRGRSIVQLTQDHSLYAEYTRAMPNLTDAERDDLPRNVITRALGMGDRVAVDLSKEEARPGDRYVLCSDGLSGMISDEQILQTLLDHEATDSACRSLIALANQHGGEDNITAIVIKISPAKSYPKFQNEKHFPPPPRCKTYALPTVWKRPFRWSFFVCWWQCNARHTVVVGEEIVEIHAMGIPVIVRTMGYLSGVAAFTACVNHTPPTIDDFNDAKAPAELTAFDQAPPEDTRPPVDAHPDDVATHEASVDGGQPVDANTVDIASADVLRPDVTDIDRPDVVMMADVVRPDIVDVVVVRDVAPPDAPVDPRTITWHIDLENPVDTTVNAMWFDIDLWDNLSTSTIADLHRRGRRVICYFSAGSGEDWRPDYRDIPSAGLGDALDGWPGERWLDTRNAGVRRVMLSRLDRAVRAGCDGVDPDNVDGYSNATGFSLRASDQLDYNRFLASEAHRRGMSVGLKNDVEQVAALAGNFDFAINESCFMYNECGTVADFVRAGKPVLQINYGSIATLRTQVCGRAMTYGFFAILSSADRLNGTYTRCIP
jgi:PPM family protein phosphatase